MFETILTSVLNRILGNYVSNLEYHQLNIGIWEGDVKLKHLRLRPDCLNSLQFPFEVSHGVLSEFSMKIPWKTLKSQPVQVTVDNLYVLLQHRENSPYDEEQELERLYRWKMGKLETAELLADSPHTTILEEELSTKNQSFMDSLITKMIDNIQVVVNNIHVRFEGFETHGQHFACGFTLKNLSVLSCNENWIEQFILDLSSRVYKLFHMDGFSIYWDTRSDLCSSKALNEDEFVEAFKNGIPKDVSDTNHAYMLKPISGLGKLRINKSVRDCISTDSSKNSFDLEFDEINLFLNHEQYYGFLIMLEHYRGYQLRFPYRRLRPSTSPSKGMEWFQYAVRCVLHDRQKKLQPWSWSAMERRRNMRREYSGLYHKSVLGAIAAAEKEQLAKLTKEIDLEDLLRYRRLVRSKINLEKPEGSSSSITSWWSYLWGSSESTAPPTQEKDAIFQLYDTIGYRRNQSSIDFGPLTDLYRSLDVNFSLKSFSITIEHLESLFQRLVCKVSHLDCFYSQYRFLSRKPDAETPITLTLRLKDIVASEQISQESLFECLLKSQGSSDGDFLRLSYESGLHTFTKGSSLFTLTMEPLVALLNKELFHPIQQFFFPYDAQKLDQDDDFMMSLLRTSSELSKRWTQWKTITKANLDYFFQSRKHLMTQIDIRAPILYFPTFVEKNDYPVLVLDLGHFHMKSIDPLDITAGPIHADQVYEKFAIKVSDLQLLYYPSISHCVHHDCSTSIIQPTNLDLALHINMLGQDSGLPFVKIPCSVNGLSIHLADMHYWSILHILDSFFPPESEAEIALWASIERKLASFTEKRPFISQESLLEPEEFYDASSEMVEGQDKYVEPESVKEKLEKLLSRVFLLATIEISNIVLTLYQSQEPAITKFDFIESPRPLAKLQCQKVHLTLEKKEFLLLTTVVLTDLAASVYLPACRQLEFPFLTKNSFRPARTGRLNTLEEFLIFQSTQHEKELILVSVTKVNPIHPFYQSSYHQVEYSVDIQMESLCIHMDDLVFAAMYRYILRTFTTSIFTTATIEAPLSKQPLNLALRVSIVKVLFGIHSQLLRLVDIGFEHAMLDIAMTLVDKNVGLDTFHLQKKKISGSLGKFTIFTAYDDEKQSRNMTRFYGSTAFSFLFETFTKPQLLSRPDLAQAVMQNDAESSPRQLQSLLEIRASSLMITYFMDGFRDLLNFWQNLQLSLDRIDEFMDGVKHTQVSEPKVSSLLHYRLDLETPILFLPRVSSVPEPWDTSLILVCHLGHMKISNTYSFPSHHAYDIFFSMDLTDLAFHSIDFIALANYDPSSGMDRIVDQTSLHVSTSMVSDATNRQLIDFKVMVTFHEALMGQLSIDDYHLLIERILWFFGSFGDLLGPDNGPRVKSKDVHKTFELKVSIPSLGFRLLVDSMPLCLFSLNRIRFTHASQSDSSSSILMDSSGFQLQDLRSENELIHDLVFPYVPSGKHTRHLSQNSQVYYEYSVSSSGEGFSNLIIDSPRLFLIPDLLVAMKSILLDGFPQRDPSDSHASRTISFIQLFSAEAFIMDSSNAPELVYFKMDTIEANRNDITNTFLIMVDGVSASFMPRQEVVSSLQSGTAILDAISILDPFSIEYLDIASKHLSRTLSIKPNILLKCSYQDLLLLLRIYKDLKFRIESIHPQTLSFHRGYLAPPTTKETVLLGDCASIRLFLIDDASDVYFPSFDILANDIKMVADASKNSLSITFQLSIDFFFVGKSNWQPVLEPCKMKCESVDIKQQLFALDSLELTCTLDLLSWMSSFSHVLSDVAQHRERIYKKKDPYIVENLTGSPLKIWIASEVTPKHTKRARPSLSVPMSPPSDSSTISMFDVPPAASISISTYLSRLGLGALKGEVQKSSLDYLSLHILESSWETLKDVLISREGCQLMDLKPYEENLFEKLMSLFGVSVRKDWVQQTIPMCHKLLCKVSLIPGSNQKKILLQSPIVFKNNTSWILELSSVSADIPPTTVILHPNERTGISPISAYFCRWRIRPLLDTEYTWSQTTFHWLDCLSFLNESQILDNFKRSSLGSYKNLELECKSSSGKPIFLYVDPVPLSPESLSSSRLEEVYPMFQCNIVAPLKFSNLLPYDIFLNLTDNDLKLSQKQIYVPKGQTIENYHVSLFHLLGMSIDIGFAVNSKPSKLFYNSKDVTVIHSGDFPAFIKSKKGAFEVLCGKSECDHEIVLLDVDRKKLILNCSYESDAVDVSSDLFHLSPCKKVVISCPYVLCNLTSIPLSFRHASMLNPSTRATLSFSETDSETIISSKTKDPILFSYGSFHLLKNRVQVTVEGRTNWSKPISFEAIGTHFSITLPSNQPDVPCYCIGVGIAPGEGMYHRSKFIHFYYRYALYSELACTSVVLVNYRMLPYLDLGHLSFGAVSIQPYQLTPYHVPLEQSLNLEKHANMADPATDSYMKFFADAFEELQGHEMMLRTPSMCSSPLDPNQLGNYYLFLGTLDALQKGPPPILVQDALHLYLEITPSNDSCLIQCDSALDGSTNYIIMKKATYWPFLFVNKSRFVSIEFHQATSHKHYRLPQVPRGSEGLYYAQPYSWDLPSLQERRIVIRTVGANVSSKVKEIEIHHIGTLKPFSYTFVTSQPKDRKQHISIEISPLDTAFIITFTDYKVPPSDLEDILSVLDPFSSKENINTGRESPFPSISISETSSVVSEPEPDTMIYEITLRLPSFGLSLVDSEELLYVSGKSLLFSFHDTTHYQTYGLNIGWIQMDNQLVRNSEGGIVLYPSFLKQSNGESLPAIKCGLIKKKKVASNTALKAFEYAGAVLQEMTVELDESYLRRLVSFFDFSAASPFTRSLSTEELFSRAFFPAAPSQPPSFIMSSSTDNPLLYFEMFQLHPVKLNLTFTRDEEITYHEINQSGTNPFGFLVDVLTVSLGNIHEAPLKFNTLLLLHPVIAKNLLFRSIVEHYRSQALSQFHRLIGSADFLGNPIGLFTSIGSGVTDLFYEPFMGFVSDRPQDLGIGLAKGGASFVKNTVFGFADTFSKFTTSIAKGLSLTTLDEKYQRSRMKSRKNKPKHAISGVAFGAKSFLTSVASGITGIVEQPVEGARSSGITGFLKGVGKGLVGVVTKPIVGMVDMAANLSEGIRNTTTAFDDAEIEKARLPRCLPYDGLTLKPYSARDAYGQWMLFELVHGGKCDDLDTSHLCYVAHLDIPQDQLVILLCSSGILCFQTEEADVQWALSWYQLTGVTRGFDYIRLDVMVPQDIQEGHIERRFIEVSDTKLRDWFLGKIEQAWTFYAGREVQN